MSKILVCTSKIIVQDYDLGDSPELENNLREKGKDELLNIVQETTDINLYFIRQSHPRGLGDAVLTAKSFIGDEPFVVMLGDDLMSDEEPLTKQLVDRYNTTGESTLAVMKVPHDQVSEYGVIAPEKEVEEGLHQVNTFVEKPKPEDAPSDLAIIGRYLLTPEIFEELEKTEPGKGNEIQLTDAIDSLNKRQHVYAHEFKGSRYDIGSKIGFLTTNIEFGLKHPQTSEDLKAYIKELAAKLD